MATLSKDSATPVGEKRDEAIIHTLNKDALPLGSLQIYFLDLVHLFYGQFHHVCIHLKHYPSYSTYYKLILVIYAVLLFHYYK